tara:strand:- start:41 stop:454 length:414 start_codon:yes stop_codon:yes gene_type:complete
MAGFKGGCLCGAVKYEVEGEPVRVAQCHCDDCRRATGSAFATNIFVEEKNLKILYGSTSSYQHIADSGNTMTKEFCPICGSQLFGYGSGSPGIKNVKIGSIDKIGDIKPQVEVFTSKSLPYTPPLEFTEKFEKGRPR